MKYLKIIIASIFWTLFVVFASTIGYQAYGGMGIIVVNLLISGMMYLVMEE